MYEEEAEADEKSQEVENKMRKARGEQEQKLNNFPSPPPHGEDLQHNQKEGAQKVGGSRLSAPHTAEATPICGAAETPLRCLRTSTANPSVCGVRDIDTPPTVHRTLYSRRAANSDSVAPDAHEDLQDDRVESNTRGMLTEQDSLVDAIHRSPKVAAEALQDSAGVRQVEFVTGILGEQREQKGGDGSVHITGTCKSSCALSPEAEYEASGPASADKARTAAKPHAPVEATLPLHQASSRVPVDNIGDRPTHEHHEKGGSKGQNNEEDNKVEAPSEQLAAASSIEATRPQDEAARGAQAVVQKAEVSMAPPPPPPAPPGKGRLAEAGEAGASGAGQVQLRRLHWDKIGIHKAQQTIWQSDAMRHAASRVAGEQQKRANAKWAMRQGDLGDLRDEVHDMRTIK